jgi:hypothetical protein
MIFVKDSGKFETSGFAMLELIAEKKVVARKGVGGI